MDNQPRYELGHQVARWGDDPFESCRTCGAIRSVVHGFTVTCPNASALDHAAALVADCNPGVTASNFLQPAPVSHTCDKPEPAADSNAPRNSESERVEAWRDKNRSIYNARQKKLMRERRRAEKLQRMRNAREMGM